MCNHILYFDSSPNCAFHDPVDCSRVFQIRTTLFIFSLDVKQMKYAYISNFNILECSLFEEPSAQQGWVAGYFFVKVCETDAIQRLSNICRPHYPPYEQTGPHLLSDLSSLRGFASCSWLAMILNRTHFLRTRVAVNSSLMGVILLHEYRYSRWFKPFVPLFTPLGIIQTI